MNKGYTLIELLAVIILLGIITSITVISVNDAASKRAAEDYKKLVKTIETSAEIYADENDTILNKLSTTGNSCKFKYQKLIDVNLVDSDQKDPRTKRILSGNNYIVVTVQSGYKLKYQFINVDNGETTSAQNCE